MFGRTSWGSRIAAYGIALVAVATLLLLFSSSLLAAPVPFNTFATQDGPTAQGAAKPASSWSELDRSSINTLRQIPGSASGVSPNQATPLGNVTLSPEPGAYDPNSLETVTVTLTPSANLSSLIDQESDVASPEYRHYLSANELGEAYGSPAYDSVAAYFAGFGLHVVPSATRLSMSLSGSVAAISAAFHTSMQSFSESYRSNGVWLPAFGPQSGMAGTTETGPVVYANTASAELPGSIATVVSGIAGLSPELAQPDLSLPVGMYPSLSGSSNNTTGPCALGVEGVCQSQFDLFQNNSVHDFIWTDFNRSDVTCEFKGICGGYQFLFPSTVPALTGATALWNGSFAFGSKPDQGQSVTVGLIEVGCISMSDLSKWSDLAFGNPDQVTSRLTQIAVGFTGSGTANGTSSVASACDQAATDSGWYLETTIDVEYLAAMAPEAHIDIIGIPAPGNLSAFDFAYADVAQYLSLGSTHGSCPSEEALSAAEIVFVNGSTVGAACSVTITSNSYGISEETGFFYGSPAYIAAQDEELEVLNAVGVTNFFSSGDYGGTSGIIGAISDTTPAESPGATSVGGAQVTASYGGSPFPVTSDSFTYCDAPPSGSTCSVPESVAYAAPASGIYSTAYWAYGEGSNGAYVGLQGGGFGQSLTESQPWWQNSMDSYSSGARIDPIVSLAAAFNLTVFLGGNWQIFYGGTSFACPMVAGEWALLEEDAAQATGTPEMGNVNPLLFAAHNAFQAGVFQNDPYTPTGDGRGYDSAPANSLTWAYYNSSIEVPSAPVQPDWFASLGNPAGSGWNYLQGLGVPNASRLAEMFFGSLLAPGVALAVPALSIELAGSSMPDSTPTSLVAGTTVTLKVVPLSGGVESYTVLAYSGQSNDGTFGGGTTNDLQTSSDGTFTYSPSTGTAPGGAGATTYGYFVVRSVSGSSIAASTFDSFAVEAAPPTGPLSLCVVDPYGVCQPTVAQVTTTTTTMVGYFNFFGQSEVYLNGIPVPDAVVTQTSDVTQFHDVDPSLPSKFYAPGIALGSSLSDLRGEAPFWIDGYTSEFNGTLQPDVYTLRAVYDGLASNNVTVFAEPQSGTFYTGDLKTGFSGGSASVGGELTFADMKYVDSINVSLGSSPGAYQNWTCPLPAGAPQPPGTLPLPGCAPLLDDRPGVHLWESGVSWGSLEVSLQVAGVTGSADLSIEAVGSNDLSIQYCSNIGTPTVCYGVPSIQPRLIWDFESPIGTAPPAPGGASTGGPKSPDLLLLIVLSSAAGAGAGAAVVYFGTRRRPPRAAELPAGTP